MLKNTHFSHARETAPGCLSPESGSLGSCPLQSPSDNLAEATALDHFFCNSKNEFPVKVLHSIASNEPGSQYAKLLLMGASGIGKSHLLKAMATLFSATQENGPVFLADSAEWLNANTDPAQAWQTAKVILLDDVQELVGTQEAQSKLVSLLAACPANSQLVLAYSGTTDGLKQFQPRLASRLAEILTLNLLEPDLDVRMRYMEHEAVVMGLEIDHQTVIYVAQRCKSIPSVRGMLQKIKAFTTIHRRNLIHNDISKILHSGKTTDVPEYLEIINRVAKSLGVKSEDVLGNKRGQLLVQARQISMYICRTSLGLSYTDLGRAFGGKDHSTVIHAVNKIKNLVDTNREMNNLVTQLSSNAA